MYKDIASFLMKVDVITLKMHNEYVMLNHCLQWDKWMSTNFDQDTSLQLWLLTVFRAWVDPCSYQYIIPHQITIVEIGGTNSAVWRTSRCLGKLLSTWQTTFSLSLTADDVGCDLPVTEPVSFHGPTTFSATEASLLLDPEYGMLYLQNSDTTSALDFLGANWSRICLSRALNHGALWHIVFLHLRNILTYSECWYI